MEDNIAVQDVQIRCIEPTCGELFTWTVGEQIFLQTLVDEGKLKEVAHPKRCVDCRAKRKAKFNQENNG